MPKINGKPVQTTVLPEKPAKDFNDWIKHIQSEIKKCLS